MILNQEKQVKDSSTPHSIKTKQPFDWNWGREQTIQHNTISQPRKGSWFCGVLLWIYYFISISAEINYIYNGKHIAQNYYLLLFLIFPSNTNWFLKHFMKGCRSCRYNFFIVFISILFIQIRTYFFVYCIASDFYLLKSITYHLRISVENVYSIIKIKSLTTLHTFLLITFYQTFLHWHFITLLEQQCL